MAAWEPELHVPAALAGELVATQFDIPGPLEHLGDGWDFTVYRAGTTRRDLVFRFPRRSAALECLAVELAVLPELGRRLLPQGFRIPEPRHVGVPSPAFPHPFWGGAWIPGEELATADLPDHERAGLAAQVGRFLAVLHSIPAEGLSLRRDPNRRGSPAHRAGMLPGHLAGDPRIIGWSAAGTGSELVTSHGDLHLRHLLVADGALSGVIDWGDACLADPSVDLSIAFSGFSGQARSALLDEYARVRGGVDEQTEARARVLAVQLCAALREYAAAEGRAALEAGASAGIARALS